jgi:biopolymer transport protein ExbB
LSLGALVLSLLLLPGVSRAWWNADFKQRTRITLNTSAAGVDIREAQSSVAVPVRLHSGNFDFVNARTDGADLRVVAGDDKTPLKFAIERFDAANELAVVWVQLPTVAPLSDKNVFYVYADNPKATAQPAAAVFDSATRAAFHFADADGRARDAVSQLTGAGTVAAEPGGLIGPAARLDGNAVEWPASDTVRAASGAPWAVSLWVKPAGNSGQLLTQGAFSLALDGGKAVLRLGRLQLAGGDLPVGAWAHVAATLGAGRAVLYVNGQPAGQADVLAPAPAIEGPLRVGAGFAGVIDELQLAAVARSADWVKFTRAAQGADAKLIASVTETQGGSGGGGGGYFSVLVGNLTVDAWVVIGILGVMFAVACWVMVTKAVFVTRMERDNRRFVSAFRDAPDVLAAARGDEHPHSSLARLYGAGVAQLNKRDIGREGTVLSGASLDAVRAAVDADLVRENQRLNSAMVLLTIAISGGPFLGLLGTVVGVMITFAAIAAAGDVNVNAIAPGIAAALLATVAGLGVAIPALFGYNWLAARIKNIASEMQIFVDEFVTRVAERYGAP